MTYLNFEGLLITLGIILIISLYVIFKHIIFNQGSLRNQEALHRLLLIIGGMLIGVGFGSQVRLPKDASDAQAEFVNTTDSDLINNQFWLGILLLFLGIIFILIGSVYLKQVLWTPMEQISEYSASFGDSFIATRLPLVGGKELIRFSERFNENAFSLANKLASLEIQLDILKNSTSQTITAGDQLGGQTSTISDNISSYHNYVIQQESILSMIETKISSFIEWYNETQERLDDQFNEIRSIAEVGNMLSINASIEAINLKEANPGIETIASKLHEMAGSLDSRQEALGKIIREVKTVYDNFNIEITDNLSKIKQVSLESSKIVDELDASIQNIKMNEIEINNSSKKLMTNIENVLDVIPNPY